MNVVVIPCFNEATRIDMAAMSAAVAGGEWRLVFVDDGSTDSTFSLLEELRQSHPQRVTIVRLLQNVGKGEAVRTGMRTALEEDGVEIVAYLDADLSTPFDELSRLVNRLGGESEIDVVLGCRVLRLGADIRRSSLRHLTGRVYATAASVALGVSVYDTQCGAKAFRRTPCLFEALAEPFAERWSFDVELLSRLTWGGGTEAWASIVEEPLVAWHDRSGSKLGPLAAARAIAELARIGYRRRRQ